MDMKMFNAVKAAVENVVGDEDRVVTQISGCFVDSPSHNYNYTDDGECVSVDTDTFTEWPLDSDKAYLLLSLEDLNKEQVVEFLSEVLEELKDEE